ncbi:PREDICTED: probable inactive purple acid phosphatase 29 [Nelumbo nucifera]|uniref:Probable inactive purple acid phosphatase 29 n=1 Tax=Nelumbo nucifera TaxID=4432 RepID=A0A1U8B5S7_NELNU|nr:PREDICTED: probable inactive purple acid phosphatase 29 [Nelumbo nucifera]
MHYANGNKTRCQDVLPEQMTSCSDLNTTAFLERLIHLESPDLIVFNGDNILDYAGNAIASMDAAFGPAVSSRIPWAAVLGTHDRPSTLSSEEVMKHIVTMNGSLSQLNPPGYTIDGFGNYNLEVGGVEGSSLHNKSVLNLYFLDSGGTSDVLSIPGFGWIKLSQQLWFKRISNELEKAFMEEPEPQKRSAPGLMYFHIPLPEYAMVNSSNIVGVKQENVNSASVNSGFFTTMEERGDVKAVFTGHDHINDFCGNLMGIHLCYGGGFGYNGYGKEGWARRARVVLATLEQTDEGEGGWGAVSSIKTWKRLDDTDLSLIDSQVLWSKDPGSTTNNTLHRRYYGHITTTISATSPLCCLSWNMFPMCGCIFLWVAFVGMDSICGF